MHPHRLSRWELWEHARTAGSPRKPNPSAHRHPRAHTKGSLGCWLRSTNPSHAHSQTRTESILTRWAAPPTNPGSPGFRPCSSTPRTARTRTAQDSSWEFAVYTIIAHRYSTTRSLHAPRVANGSLNPRTNSSPRGRSQLRSNLSTWYRTWGHGGVAARSSSSNAAPWEEHEPPRSEARGPGSKGQIGRT